MPNLTPLLLSAQGRIGRQTFVVVGAGLFVVSLLFGLLPVVGPLVSIALMWPWTAIAIKRLHDMNRSGAPAVVLSSALAVLLAVSFAAGMLITMPALFLTLAAIVATISALLSLASLVFLLWIGLSKGAVGANRYGEPETVQIMDMWRSKEWN